MKLFKTRSLTGMWWVRTSVSEESLCAPSLTQFPRRGRKEDQGDVGLEEGKEEGGDFPATSKQMTDHRPEGSVSTAPVGNGRISEQELWCQSVHHPLSKCHSITAPVWSTTESAEEEEKPTAAKQTLTCWRASLLFIIPSFPKTLRVRVSAQISSPLSFSPAMKGFSHSTGTWITPIRAGSLDIRSHRRVFSWPFPLRGV